jgi:hypothetical protein
MQLNKVSEHFTWTGAVLQRHKSLILQGGGVKQAMDKKIKNYIQVLSIASVPSKVNVN